MGIIKYLNDEKIKRETHVHKQKLIADQLLNEYR